jgi:hypothetical protein
MTQPRTAHADGGRTTAEHLRCNILHFTNTGWKPPQRAKTDAVTHAGRRHDVALSPAPFDDGCTRPNPPRKASGERPASAIVRKARPALVARAFLDGEAEARFRARRGVPTERRYPAAARAPAPFSCLVSVGKSNISAFAAAQASRLCRNPAIRYLPMMGEYCGPARGVAAAMLLVASVAFGHTENAYAQKASGCGADALGDGRVAAIEDSRTLRLDDGRKIRLAGIEWAVPADTARSRLASLVLNRHVTLKGARTPDRYGRIDAFPSVSGSETPIQYALLDEGLAVASSRIGDKACREALLLRERAVRGTGLGIFATGDYRLHKADDPAAILRGQGRYAIVEGRVLSVRESGNTIYVNFGRNWSQDFTVTIAKRNEPTFISAGLPPKSFAGRTLRVRGVIEERAGPWIEATGPQQFDWDGQQ